LLKQFRPAFRDALFSPKSVYSTDPLLLFLLIWRASEIDEAAFYDAAADN
jgi:hypothetical protein